MRTRRRLLRNFQSLAMTQCRVVVLVSWMKHTAARQILGRQKNLIFLSISVDMERTVVVYISTMRCLIAYQTVFFRNQSQPPYTFLHPPRQAVLRQRTGPAARPRYLRDQAGTGQFGASRPADQR